MAEYHHGLSSEAIARAGANLGLHELSLGAVARVLGVSTPALYRHVKSREHLEKLVAAELLKNVHVTRVHPSARSYLFYLAHTLFDVCQDNPGLGQYLIIDFPSDPQSARLQQESIAALTNFGFTRDSATALGAVTAHYSIALAITSAPAKAANITLEVSPGLALEIREIFSLMISPAIDGVLAAITPGVELPEVIAELRDRMP